MKVYLSDLWNAKQLIFGLIQWYTNTKSQLINNVGVLHRQIIWKIRQMIDNIKRYLQDSQENPESYLYPIYFLAK